MPINISAFRGRDNVEDIEFNRNGLPINFAAEGVTAIKAQAGGATVNAVFNGNKVGIKFGDLGIPAGIYQTQIIIYSANSPKGEVIAGPGREIEIELQYNG